MPSLETLTRRSFLKTFRNGMGVGLTVVSLPTTLLAQNTNTDSPLSAYTPPTWAPNPGRARHRVDGLPKVRGGRIFARDFRVRDFPSWPQVERVAHALCCGRVDRMVTGYDLSMLPSGLQPMTVVDQGSLDAAHMLVGGSMEENKAFFARPGEAPAYYGQPVAILLFANWATYRRALTYLEFNERCITWGAEVPPRAPETYAPVSHYVRDDTRNFSHVDTDPAVYDRNYSAVAAQVHEEVERQVNKQNWRKYSREFNTQAVDPMFMEPEAGLAWYDPDKQKLHLLLGTQSPTGDIENAAQIYSSVDALGRPDCRFQLNPADGIELISCYPGGGFGGRDSSYFSMYLAMLAPFADGPVRWALSRYEQFQMGLKRHNTAFSETLALSPDGKLQALECSFTLDGGGRKNLSPYAAQVAALSSYGAYDIPRATAQARAVDTSNLIGGSQRGFGTPQAVIAMETLLDEAAADLGIDPFTLRRRNLLSQGGKTATGAPVLQDLQLEQILDSLEQQPLWQNRFARQQELARQGKRYGVGLALSNKACGTNRDGMYAGIDIQADGRLIVRTPYIDMGNGAATSMGLAPAAFLGRNADNMVMGDAAGFAALNLSTATTPEDALYVYEGSGSASASMGAFHQHHVVQQAARVLLIAAVMPAVNRLWGTDMNPEQISWQDGACQSPGLPTLSWASIVSTMLAMNLPVSAKVHASYQAQFITADFAFDSGILNLPLDYIALSTVGTKPVTVPRTGVQLPPVTAARYGRSIFAPCAALVGVSIDQTSGEVRVEECISALSAGVLHCPELVHGQSEGAVAMAIGYTLMEECPTNAEGPGKGTWNLHNYRVPKIADVPGSPKLLILPPAPGETTGRGIAEAVMCPIPPAILNALAMATGGVRFTQLPVTASMLKEVLA